MDRPSRNITRSRRGKSPTRYSSVRKSPRKRSPGRSPSAGSTRGHRSQSTNRTKFAKVSLPRIEVSSGK